MNEEYTIDDSSIEQLEASIADINAKEMSFSSNEPITGNGISEESETVKEDKTDEAKSEDGEGKQEESNDSESDGTQESNIEEDSGNKVESNTSSNDKKRLAKSWKTLQAAREKAENEEKARREEWDKFVANEKQRLNNEIEAARRAREELESKKQEEELKGSPEQYERIAKEAEERGDSRIAELAREQADFLRAKKAEKEAFELKKREESVKQERLNWVSKAVEELPELNDTSSDIHKDAIKFLNDNKDIASLPRAPWLAGQWIKLNKEIASQKELASRVPLLEKEKEDLIKQIDDLKKKMSPSASPSNTPLTKPTGGLSDMSIDELEKKLKEAYNQ